MNNIEILEKIITRCKECKFATCENCEINWNEVQAIENLIQENKELKEGNKTMLSDEERKAIDELWHFDCAYNREIKIVLNLIEKQSKEIEHQKEKRENQKQELAILNAKQIEFNKLVNTVNSYKGQFKRQQKEIEEYKREKETNQQMIKLAETQILGYGQGYKDGLNKETTATAIVARERENQIIYEGMKHKINMEWVLKIKAEIEELKNMKVDGEVFTTAVNFAIKEMQSLLEKE